MTNMYNNWFSLFSLIKSFVKNNFRHTPTSLFGQNHHYGKQRKLISNDELDLGSLMPAEQCTISLKSEVDL